MGGGVTTIWHHKQNIRENPGTLRAPNSVKTMGVTQGVGCVLLLIRLAGPKPWALPTTWHHVVLRYHGGTTLGQNGKTPLIFSILLHFSDSATFCNILRA